MFPSEFSLFYWWPFLSLVGLVLLALFVISLIWVYADAEKRGGLGCLMAILTFLSWPWGLVAWLLLRPDEQSTIPSDLRPVRAIPRTAEPTTIFQAANEREARVIQQLLIGSGIPCQIAELTSGAVEIQVAKVDKEAAVALLEIQSFSPPEPSDIEVAETRAPSEPTLCTHCQIPLDYLGEKEFDMRPLQSRWAKLSVYLCPQCYRVNLVDKKEDETFDLVAQSKTRYEILSQRTAQLIDQNQLQAAIGMYQQIIREFPDSSEEAVRCIRVLNARLVKGE